MITLLDPFFWLYFVLFSIAVFLAFFVPGDFILRKLNLPFFQRVILGTMVGFVLWGWQGFIFGYLGLRGLSYFYLLISFFLWLKTNPSKEKDELVRIASKKFDPILAVIIIFGVLLQLTAVWASGIYLPEGLYFCCGNLEDSLLHIALTNQLVKQFPPYEPGMSGVFVQNYHYWGNLVAAELIRVFHLPLIATQYRYLTVFISLFLGLSAVTFAQINKLHKNFARWLIFFLYFGGDLIFLLLLILGKGSKLFTMSSLEDGSKFLVNPPRAIAIVIFFAGISLFSLWIKRKDFFSGFLTAILFGSLVGFKIYVGIFALIGLGVLGGYYLLRKNFHMIAPLILTPIISLIIYLPVNAAAGGLYFVGMWRFEDFIVNTNLGLINLELARRIFLEHSNWLRVMQYELIFIFLYVSSIFGTKLIGLFQNKKSLSLLPYEINIFLISGFIASGIAGFFFQQKSGGPNTFNFLISIFIIGSIYTALSCYYWLKETRNKYKFIIILVLVLLTATRVMHEEYVNISRLIKKEGYLIANNELQALKYLREKTEKNSLVLVDYRNFYIDTLSPYVSFLADRPMFLSGMINELEAHGIDFADRKANVETIFRSTNVFEIGNILSKNRIDFLYMRSGDNLLATESAYFLKPVFQNKNMEILSFSLPLARDYFRKHKVTLDEKSF